jgi:pyruvate-formate lyase-activating enzyme
MLATKREKVLQGGVISPIADKRGLTHVNPFVPEEDTCMTDRIYNAYELEYKRGAVNVGSKCNRACFYCSQFWNPADLMPNYNGYLTLDEVKNFLKLVPDKHIECLGAGITRVNMGEFFFHPQALEILEYIRDEEFSLYSIVTNGSLITEDMIRVIKEIDNNSIKRGLPSSYQLATGTRNEAQSDDYGGIDLHLTNYSQKMRRVLENLDKYEVPYAIILIADRHEVDIGRIERWIKEMEKHNPIFIRMELASWTKYATSDIIAKMEMPRSELNFLVEGWREKYPKHEIKFWTGRDDAAHITLSLNWFMMNYRNYSKKENPNTLFLCSEAVKDIFEPTIEIFQKRGYHFINNYNVISVKNETFGGNVECAGLLLVDDYIAAIEKAMANGMNKPDMFVTSGQSFEYDGVDLALIPPKVISDRFQTNIMYC